MTRAFAFLFSVAAVAAAQVSIFVPDSSPSTSSACTAIPFGSNFNTFTYGARVPASYLNAAQPRLMDIGFANCLNGGVWLAQNIHMAVGHVPNPLPNPFIFPSPGFATIGSFLDLTPVYDSTIQGPLTWTMTQNAWTLLGLGGTSFCWNGVNDIAVFITYQQPSLTSMVNPLFHRGGPEPRWFISASSYWALQSTATSSSGLKMQLNFQGCTVGPQYQVNQPQSALTLDGVSGSSLFGASILRPQSTLLTVASSTISTAPLWEAVLGSGPPVSLGNGALLTSDGQLLNVNLSLPFSFLNGGLFPAFMPYPGTFAATINSGATPGSFAFQQAITTPALLSGFALSQPCQLIVP